MRAAIVGVVLSWEFNFYWRKIQRTATYRTTLKEWRRLAPGAYGDTIPIFQRLGLLRRDFYLCIAARCGCMNSFYDTLDVDPKLWPSLSGRVPRLRFFSLQILLVA